MKNYIYQNNLIDKKQLRQILVKILVQYIKTTTVRVIINYAIQKL